jgi:hypothetical protein
MALDDDNEMAKIMITIITININITHLTSKYIFICAYDDVDNNVSMMVIIMSKLTRFSRHYELL